MRAAEGRTRCCAQARQPVCQQGAEAVSEEHMRTVECRSQLLTDLVNELAQRGESLAVENLDGDYVDAPGRAPCSSALNIAPPPPA